MKTPRWIGIPLLLIGCGGGSGNVSIENFPQKYAEALCSKNFSCCDASELAGKTMSTCVTDNQAVLAILISDINASRTQGRVSYDPGASGTCIDSLKAMTCEEFKQGIGGNTDACMAALTPAVALGGACTQDYECTTNNCEGATTNPPADGTCGPAPVLAGVNSSCAANACVDTAYCDSATTTCQPKKSAGESCTADDQCVNSCNETTGMCSCYAGCSVSDATPASASVLWLGLLGLGFAFIRRPRHGSRRWGRWLRVDHRPRGRVVARAR
jgi:MYXO-CTERM domain-containing protein